MKKWKFGIIAIGSFLLFLTVFLISCDKDNVTDVATDVHADRSEFPSKEEVLKLARETPMKIEQTSVREYNEIMREHGLPEYVPKGDENFNKRGGCASPNDCADMNMLCFLGDYNHDNVLSTLDLVLLQQHCIANCIQYYPSQWEIYLAAMSSDVVYGIEADKWDYNDIGFLHDAILCRSYICNP